jgi:hypothetical protein
MHSFLGPSDPKLTHSIPRRPVLKNRGIIELANAQAEGRKVVRMISHPDPGQATRRVLRVLAGELQLRSDVGSR